jgi:hypothetical protein
MRCWVRCKTTGSDIPARCYPQPAIDAATKLYSATFNDQRGPGFDRVVNGRIDKGSFEAQGPAPDAHTYRHGYAKATPTEGPSTPAPRP